MNQNNCLKIVLLIASLCLFTSCENAAHGNKEDDQPTAYADIVLGQHYTDISSKLILVTNRTDLIQDTPDGMEFPDYIEKFNKLYPNIAVTVEGIADYDTDMAARLSSGNWGDICCIPAAVPTMEYPDYFEPLGSYDELDTIYEFVIQATYKDTVYGIPSSGNVQGIVYNKRIWDEAGITKLPKTPDEFIRDLEQIKEKTDAIPLYTNYEAIWSLVTWDAYIFSCATGNEDYKHFVLPHEKAPFSKKADNTGPYEVYNILYQAVSRKLTEDDPSATSWELSKSALNRGEISAMVLGGWAVSQIQDADSHPEDVRYMPFPISVNDVQYSIAIGDYSYGINCKTSDEKKTAAKIFMKYLLEDSGYAYDQGSIPTLKGGQYPNTLESFKNTTFLKDTPPDNDAEGDILAAVSQDSEIKLGSDAAHVTRIIDSALSGSETMDEIADDWNRAWNRAQEKNNITIRDN